MASGAMLFLIFYYLVLPFVAAALVLRFIRRFGADPTPEAVRRNCLDDPVERKWFRVLEKRAGEAGETRFTKVGDFDAHEKAVDAAYGSRKAAGTPGALKNSSGISCLGVSWIVVNERGDVLEEVA